MEATPNEAPPQSNKNKFIIAGVVGLLIICLIVLAVMMSNKDKEVAVIGDKVLYTSDVKTAAEKVYAKQFINSKVLSKTETIVIEREILDQEAKRMGISVTEENVLEYIRENQKNVKNISENLKETVKYQILKDKIIENDIESRTATIIGLWIPGTKEVDSYPKDRADLANTRRKIMGGMIDESFDRMQQNEDPAQIWQDMRKKYPLLSDVLAYNGYRLPSNKTSINFTTDPTAYVYAPDEDNKPMFDTLFEMKEGEVKKVINNNEAGGNVIKLIKITHSGYKTYDEWLAAKKKELVKDK